VDAATLGCPLFFARRVILVTSSAHTDLRGLFATGNPCMYTAIKKTARWLRLVWSEARDESTRTWRRHVRGLIIGWALTAGAMALMQLYPNDADLSMYGLLLTQGLPWQQQLLAAMEIAAPLLMGWHLFGLQRWGQRRLNAD
jgi:hypothetical protein